MSGLLYSPEPFFIFQTWCLENDPKAAVCCLRKKQQAKQSALPSWCCSEELGLIQEKPWELFSCALLGDGIVPCWPAVLGRHSCEGISGTWGQAGQAAARASCKAQPGPGGEEPELSLLTCCSLWLCSHAQGNVTAESVLWIQTLAL